MLDDSRRDTPDATPSTERADASSPHVQMAGKKGSGGRLATLYRSACAWLVENALTPAWLPAPWRNPAVGYAVAALGQLLASALSLAVLALLPKYGLPGALGLLVTVLVAISFGRGPSLLAALLGAVLTDYVVLEPHFVFSVRTAGDIAGILFYLSIGVTISVLPSQVERARRAAAARSEQLQATFDAMEDGVILYDAEGRIVARNPALVRMFGLGDFPEYATMPLPERQARTQPRDATSGELIPPERLPQMRVLRGETLTGDRALDMLLTALDGRAFEAIVSAAPLRDAEGRITGAVAVYRDITDRRQAEGEAAERSAQLQATFESMGDGVLVYDAQGDLLRTNARARELFGLDAQPDYPDRPLAMRAARLDVRARDGTPVPRERWPVTRLLNGEVLAGDTAADYLVRNLAGAERELNYSGAPVRTGDGRVAGAVMLVRDVTQRQRAERRTREALEAVLEMARILVALPYDTGGGAPEAAEDDAGPEHDSERAIAQRLADLTRRVLDGARVGIMAVDPETEVTRAIAIVGLAPALEESWWAARRADEERRARASERTDADTLVRLHAGEVVVLDMSRAPAETQPNAFGAAMRVVAPMLAGDRLVGMLWLDYTDGHREFTPDELALAGTVARLGAVVLERERLLREREEAQASALALREANRRMDEFLSIASHELKTPLTTIKMNAQIAERRVTRMAGEATARRYDNAPDLAGLVGLIARMASAALRQERLVNDLLDVSRIQAGKLDLRLARMDLAALVRDAVDEQRLAHPGRDIALAAPDGPLWVDADDDRIRQVVANYLTNALKYSAEDAPVAVRVETVDETASGGARSARVAVRDHGPGIPPDEQARVWDRFERIASIEHVSGSGIGLGLGLYICREIVERHDGAVGIASVPGDGSTFWFTLPLAPAPVG